MISRFARRYLLVRGWSFVGELPEQRKAVIVAAPHTSNWDFLVFLAVAKDFGIRPRFLGKDTLFRGPIGLLMTRWGGIAVDRSKPRHMVEAVAGHFADHDEFFLVITPEGTRGNAKVWKSGFWRIAQGADVPVVMGFVDAAKKQAGFGPSSRTDGDLHSWMDRARLFYKDIAGLKPNRKGPIVLASELAG